MLHKTQFHVLKCWESIVHIYPSQWLHQWQLFVVDKGMLLLCITKRARKTN